MKVIAALAALLAFISPALAKRDLRPELMKLEQERQAAYVAGDREVLERHFAEDYVHTNLNGGRTDRAAELAFYQPGRFSLGAGRIEDVIVHDYGKTATLMGTILWENAFYTPAPGAQPIDLSGKFSVSRVYVFRDGRWQLALSHASKLP